MRTFKRGADFGKIFCGREIVEEKEILLSNDHFLFGARMQARGQTSRVMLAILKRYDCNHIVLRFHFNCVSFGTIQLLFVKVLCTLHLQVLID